MTTLKVKVIFDEEVLGTAANDPEIHREFIASKGPNALTMAEEVEVIGAEEVFDKGMTVFPRTNDGTPFAWDYQWKGYLKDAFGSLKKVPGTECGKIKAYKKEIDGLIFVYPRKIPFDLKGGEVGICQRPLRASFKEYWVTSSLTFWKRSYSFSSRVNSLISKEPLTDRFSLISWFISSRFS